jgi:3-phenylpropionate/cinnamic acid dioxygenase small subunit
VTGTIDDTALQGLIDRQAIQDVLLRYCRGVDRRDFDLVRSCYHDDAYDLHGSYEGGPDGFIEHLKRNARWDATMHVIGNQLIELDGDLARCESYCISYHRHEAEAEDMVIGLRYVDRVERRQGEWRIAHRVCAMEWSRVDPVTGIWEFAPGTVRGRPFPDDIIYM